MTYLIRHGQTDYSSKYLVNGDPGLPLALSDAGVRGCALARASLPVTGVKTWLASGFPRAQQTAALLMDAPSSDLVTEPRLNELGYGIFEGGPFLTYAAWLRRHGPRQRPPAAQESQWEGIARMLQGVRAALDLPGPRILVAHGLLISVLRWQRDRDGDQIVPLFFPEARCLEPLAISDSTLSAWTDRLLAELGTEAHDNMAKAGECEILGAGDGQLLATFDPVSHPPEEKDSPHA